MLVRNTNAQVCICLGTKDMDTEKVYILSLPISQHKSDMLYGEEIGCA